MPVGRRATDQGTGGTEWIPCPTGTYKFEVGQATVKLSPYKNEKTGEDQYQVQFPLKLSDDEYKRVKEEYGEIPEGCDLSGRCWYTCGLTLGWIDRAGVYQTTRLADFLVMLLGAKQVSALREYIVAGGGPFLSEDATPEESMAEWNSWFGWFDGAFVWGTVTHRKDSKNPSKIRADFGGPKPVGERPGPPEPDYQAWGRGKLRMIVNQGGPEVAATIEELPIGNDPEPDPVPAYTATGETVSEADERAAMLAELEELRKLKAEQNQEKVAAATGSQGGDLSAVDEAAYKELFGAKAGA